MVCLRLGVGISLLASLCQAATVPTAQELVAKARAAQQQGDFRTAENYFRLALQSQPRSVELWNGLGVALNRQELYDQAADAFGKALALEPSIDGIRLNLGIALFRGGKLSEAAQAFERLPQQQQARELLALTYMGLQKHEQALPLLEELAPASADPSLHLALAKCYERMGRATEVEKTVARMFKVVPDGAPLHFALAEANERDSNTDGALAEYRKAAGLDPTLIGVRLRISRLLWKDRKFNEAETELEAELKNDPGSVDAKFYLASIYLYRDDNWRRATPLLKEFVRVRPNEKNGYFELGRALLKDNQVPEALRALEKAIALGPNDASSHYLLAQAYRQAGRTADASREFETLKRLRAAELEDVNKKFQAVSGKN